MLITDSQIHVWGANTAKRPWPGRAHAQREIPLGTKNCCAKWMLQA